MKKYFSAFFLIIFFLLKGQCQAFRPLVTNSSAYDLTPSSFKVSVTVLEDSGYAVTSRGICWSSLPTPTISLITKQQNGNGLGKFIAYVILPSATVAGATFYVRSFATNSKGTSYGPQIKFSIPISVSIGTQLWFQKNLDVNTYRNGDLIPEAKTINDFNNSYNGRWCWYNFDSVNYWRFGKLYNRSAVTDARGLAPTGWHVAAFDDWNKLIKYLDPTAILAPDLSHWDAASNHAGQFMMSQILWSNCAVSSSFYALPAGCLTKKYGFDNNNNIYAVWWCYPYYTIRLDIFNRNCNSIPLFFGDDIDHLALYVRCIKD